MGGGSPAPAADYSSVWPSAERLKTEPLYTTSNGKPMRASGGGRDGPMTMRSRIPMTMRMRGILLRMQLVFKK